jgi:deoxycytidylate deaminase
VTFDWNDLAFGSKKPINALKAIFIAAPREMSGARLNQLIKTYLPQGNIVLGIAKEEYIQGFENQPQFKTLRMADVEALVQKVKKAAVKHTLATLTYYQRDTKFILEKLNFKKVLFINGSWKHLFHTLPPYYVLATRGVPYELISPFASEQEARDYATQTQLISVPAKGSFSANEMLAIANQAAMSSYDYSFQTGVALGRKKGQKYDLLATTFNTVVPFQTYAMHYGATRETNFSPMHDLNHYDTVHAEVMMIIKAQKEKFDLRSTTLFINLLPCPMCSRMFTQTDIAEFVYHQDHSDGYGVVMLEKAGKKVRRIV